MYQLTLPDNSPLNYDILSIIEDFLNGNIYWRQVNIELECAYHRRVVPCTYGYCHGFVDIICLFTYPIRIFEMYYRHYDFDFDFDEFG